MTILKFFQYLYLIFFGLLTYEGIKLWSENRQRAYVMFFLAVIALFMFFFRKKFRKRFEDRRKK